MSPSITLRAATRQDSIAIAGLLTQLNRVEGNGVTTNVAQLTQALFGENRVVNLRALVVVQGAQVVGAALYYAGYDTLSATTGYHLADFVIDEQMRRQGVGKKLFAALAKQNLDEGGQWISLTALQKNETAQKFYLALGMTQVAVNFFAIGPATLHALSHA